MDVKLVRKKPFAIAFSFLLLLLPVAFVLFPHTNLDQLQAEKSARFDQWTILGPGGGGAMYFPTVSPHDPNVVLVRCDMTGAYISEDAGRSWRMFNLRSPVDFFVFDPVDPKVIYAHAAGLWRSSDLGKTWNLILPDPKTVKGIMMPDDHATVRLVTKDDKVGLVSVLAIDPENSGILYVAMGSRNAESLYVSKERGHSWSKLTDLPGGTQRIYVDPRSPKEDRGLYVVNGSSVSIRQRGQWTHCPPPAGVSAFTDVSAGFPDGGGDPVIYALAPKDRKGDRLEGGILVSTNGGRTWKPCDAPILSQLKPNAPAPRFQAVATCSTHPAVAYLSYSRLQTGPGNDSFLGVLKTTDGGMSWAPVWKEAAQSAPNIHDLWISERFGPSWGENPVCLGVAPGNPNICYGTDYGRTMRTTDGGQNWEAVYTKRTGSGTYSTTGLDVTTCYGVHFDPFERDRILISYTDIGLFASVDAGRSWRSVTQGVPNRWVNTTYWITFDPEVKGRAWGVMSGIHDLPRPKMWRRQPPSRYNGGVCISDDGGMTWRESIQGMPATAATHLLLDPHSPAKARTLYVTGFGRGVFKSIDDGRNWVLKNNGIPGSEPFAWRLAMDRGGIIYLVVARKTEDGSYGNEGDGMLFRSQDAAEHWERLRLPEGVNGPNGLAIDPEDPKRLYLAAWGRNTPQGAVSGGVFLSEDSGQSWRNVLNRDQHVYDVTLDPRRPGRVYACGFESSAWRSDDRGVTWKRIQGYNFKWGHRVVPDPRDPEMIYITTFGGSVWHGPAQGDPSATEDIVTPEVAYSKN